MEYQTESELAALVELYRALPERRYVLEIGSMMGDTLRQWLEHGDPGMKIVSVDKVVPPADSRHAAQMAAHGIWPTWAAAEAATLTVIDGYSQAPETIAAVKAAVPYLDFLFIDGGHDYATVKADYENYAPLVRPGGLIAFHDIQGIADVKRFWEELVWSGHDHEAICHPNGWGIGCIVKPDDRRVLHVITPCSRPENLPVLASSMVAGNVYFKLHWWVVPDPILNDVVSAGCTFAYGELHLCKLPKKKQLDCVAGKAQVNHALDLIQARPTAEEWVWVLDDDNVAHPDFFRSLRTATLDDDVKAVAFAQLSKSGGVRAVAPTAMKECSVDQAQFVLRRDLIGDARYLLKYTADGEFAERLHWRDPAAWQFCNEPVTYYNWLKPA